MNLPQKSRKLGGDREVCCLNIYKNVNYFRNPHFFVGIKLEKIAILFMRMSPAKK